MRVALTGAATGIGAKLVEALDKAGHTVIAFDVVEPTGPVDRWIKLDLADSTSITRAVEQAEGHFDALICNAGLPPRPGLEETILRVNFIGTRAFLTGILDKLAPGGAIVNTASRAGAMWRDNLDEVKALMALDPAELPRFIADRAIDATRAYNLSKEAVIVMSLADTEALWARKLRMNSVSPAAVSTGILEDFKTAFGEKVAANIARVGRPGLPEEVAQVILFLAAPESHWIKGQDIVVDGGMSAAMQKDMLGL